MIVGLPPSSSDTFSLVWWPSALPYPASTNPHPGLASQSSQPSQPHNFTPFVPSARFQQPMSSSVLDPPVPRSPAYPQQMTNGTKEGEKGRLSKAGAEGKRREGPDQRRCGRNKTR